VDGARGDASADGLCPGRQSCRGLTFVWIIKTHASAPSQPNVLASVDPDVADFRIPFCVVDGISAVNVDVSVRFKPVSGAGDQAAGHIWCALDQD
jgi:hypothetical protein